jgi:hypothetical protein
MGIMKAVISSGSIPQENPGAYEQSPATRPESESSHAIYDRINLSFFSFHNCSGFYHIGLPSKEEIIPDR